MPRGWRPSRTDRNQREIAEALRKAGASVADLSSVGGGVPDLLVGHRGANHLLEIKDGTLAPSKRMLTEAEARFHLLWRGKTHVVGSVREAFAVLGIEV